MAMPFPTIVAPREPLVGEIAGAPESAPSVERGGFADTLAQTFESAHRAEATAAESAERFAAGDPAMGIHETLIAAEKANITVRFAVTLKNRAIEAYRELMNTPL
jgi:flagellar hook-basal body complex protein FliE